jgi:hypothetical protein
MLGLKAHQQRLIYRGRILPGQSSDLRQLSIIDLDGVLEQCAGHDTKFLAELLLDLRREVNAQRF